MRKAARGGFNINGRNNGILLDQRFHSGGHPMFNERMLRGIEAIGRRGGTDIDIARQVQSLVDSQQVLLQRIQQIRIPKLETGARTRIFIR